MTANTCSRSDVPDHRLNQFVSLTEPQLSFPCWVYLLTGLWVHFYVLLLSTQRWWNGLSIPAPRLGVVVSVLFRQRKKEPTEEKKPPCLSLHLIAIFLFEPPFQLPDYVSLITLHLPSSALPPNSPLSLRLGNGTKCYIWTLPCQARALCSGKKSQALCPILYSMPLLWLYLIHFVVGKKRAPKKRKPPYLSPCSRPLHDLFIFESPVSRTWILLCQSHGPFGAPFAF